MIDLGWVDIERGEGGGQIHPSPFGSYGPRKLSIEKLPLNESEFYF